MEENVEIVKNAILTNKKPSYLTTNKKEIRIRCPYCGDSKKNATQAHLYIQLKPPFKFYCQKCNTSGTLNSQTARDMSIFSNDMSLAIINANKSIKTSSAPTTVSFKKKNLVNTTSFGDNGQLNYFNSRYGTGYTAEEIQEKFRVVLNPEKFFAENRIYVPPGQYNFPQSIGFISADNSHIIFRDISGKQFKRYYNLNLNPLDEETPSGKQYNISGNLNILSEETTIVLTEGIFDIIGVYEYFYKGKVDESDYIFAAVCGKGYNTAIFNYIRAGFLNLKVVIYSDADVPIEFYKNLKNSNSYLKNLPITIFYNTQEKDYGIPKERITLRKAII